MHSEPSENDRVGAFLRELMPEANDAEREAARQRLIRYIGIVLRIHERIEREVRADSRDQGTFDRFGSD